MLNFRPSTSLGALFRSVILATGLLSGPASDLSAQTPAATPSAVIPSTQRQFAIPFEIRTDHATDPAREIELLVSKNGGLQWFTESRRPLDAKSFPFQTDSDGEYWFAFRTISVAGVTRPSGSGPTLRVLVDTLAPDIDVAMQQQPGGEMLVSWKVTEKNFQGKRPDFAVSAVSAFSSEEKRIPLLVDSKHLRTAGDTMEGRFLFWPYIPSGDTPDGDLPGPAEIELRMVAVDAAGNRTEKSRTAKIKPVSSRPASPVGNLGDFSEKAENATPQGPALGLDRLNPSTYAVNRHPTAVEPITPPRPLRVRRRVREKIDNVALEPILQRPEMVRQTDDDFADWDFGETLADLESTTNEEKRQTELPVPSPVKDNEEPEDLAARLLARMDGLFEGQFHKDKLSTVKNTVDMPDESKQPPSEWAWNEGPFFPELPESPDRPELIGMAEPTPDRESMADLFGDAPSPQPAEPQAAVAENRSESTAAGRISGISLNTLTSPAQIIVKWEIGDEADRSGLIEIFRAASPEGPWQPIVRSLSNSGEYWWYLSKIDLEPFYIAVEFTDTRGKRHQDRTDSPIHVDPAWLSGETN